VRLFFVRALVGEEDKDFFFFLPTTRAIKALSSGGADGGGVFSSCYPLSGGRDGFPPPLCGNRRVSHARRQDSLLSPTVFRLFSRGRTQASSSRRSVSPGRREEIAFLFFSLAVGDSPLL